jgi:V8-like Glu-specific endopeptidase
VRSAPARAAATAGLAALLLAVVVLAAACGGTPRGGHPRLPGATGYWDKSRMLSAQPYRAPENVPLQGQPANSRIAGPRRGLRVGALFVRDSGGDHFCTASVVTSPGKDLLITAAHCINGGKGSPGYRSDIVFIPDYRDGEAPYGMWTPAKLLVSPQWAGSSNPAYDVGFVVLRPHGSQNIQQLLGASHLGTAPGEQYLVHVTGYPDTSSTPITCVNWTSEFSSTQLRFDCGGYAVGTSGSPWVIHFDSQEHTGTIIGVIGGYQEGGDTPAVSYSARFDRAIEQLYHRAEAASSQD